MKERLACAESTEKALRSRLDAEAGAAQRLGDEDRQRAVVAEGEIQRLEARLRTIDEERLEARRERDAARRERDLGVESERMKLEGQLREVARERDEARRDALSLARGAATGTSDAWESRFREAERERDALRDVETSLLAANDDLRRRLEASDARTAALEAFSGTRESPPSKRRRSDSVDAEVLERRGSPWPSARAIEIARRWKTCDARRPRC